MDTANTAAEQQTTETAPAANDSEAASLAALEAGAVEAETPHEAAQVAIAADNADAEAELIVTMIAEGLTARWPFLVYDIPTRAAVSQPLAKVLTKYGINPEFMAKYQAEIALASTVAIIGFQSYKMVKEDNERKAMEAKTDGK